MPEVSSGQRDRPGFTHDSRLRRSLRDSAHRGS